MTPPRVPRWLLTRAAPPEDRAALIGDLDEEFRGRAGATARFWYWRQALASVPSALRLRWHRAAPFNDLSGDFRRALRLIARRPVFAAAAMATMALGAGITTAVVSIAEAVLFRPLPYANASRLLAIQEIDSTRRSRTVSWLDFEELSERLQTFSAIAAYTGASRTMTGVGPAERVAGVEVTSRFFDVLGVPILHGRGFGSADMQIAAPPVVILSHQAWQRRFAGDASVIGRAVALSGVPHTVVGVLPASFVFPPRGDPELWLPLRLPRRAGPGHFLDVIGARRPDVSPGAAVEDLRVQSQGRAWTDSPERRHAAATLVAVNLRNDMVASVRPTLLIVIGAAFLVLIASAVNVSGLILARTSARVGELGVRSALGASRWRIGRELGVEAICIAIAGSAFGLFLGAWAIAIFRVTTPARLRSALPFADQLAVSPTAAAVSVAVTVTAVLAAGMIPALRAARLRNPPLNTSRTTAGRTETRLRRALVASQIAFAVVLLLGAALLGRSVLNLARVSPGFDIDGLVAGRVNLPAGRDDVPEKIVVAAGRILETVRAVPGVTGAEVIDRLPFGGRGNISEFTIPGRTEVRTADPMLRSVTPGYFRLMGIPILNGHGIQPSDTRAAAGVVVINQTLASAAFADRSPIGERIVVESLPGRPEWTVVGVVGDEQFDALDRPMAPVVYFPFAQNPAGEFSIVVRTATPEAIVSSLRSALAAVEPDLPLFGLQTLTETAAQSNAMFLRTLVMRLLAWFASATLLLGSVGVYGVLSETMAARTREIGLRFALGASRGGIARLAMIAGAQPAAIGLLAGIAVAAASSRVVGTLLFGVTPLDLLSFASVVVMVALVTVLACAVPAWRAMRLPIATALRQN